MNGIFRLRLPKLFFSSLFYHLEFLLFKLHIPNFLLQFELWENFLLITSQNLCYVFVFLGFLTLLANFGLVTPIPDGIRVLGVEAPLRT